MLHAVDECAWLGPLHPHAGDAAAVASRALQHLLSACPHAPLVELVGRATGCACDGGGDVAAAAGAVAVAAVAAARAVVPAAAADVQKT